MKVTTALPWRENLLIVAATESGSPRGYCYTTDDEVEALVPLDRAGYVRPNRRQGMVLDITERGKEAAQKYRDELQARAMRHSKEER